MRNKLIIALLFSICFSAVKSNASDKVNICLKKTQKVNFSSTTSKVLDKVREINRIKLVDKPTEIVYTESNNGISYDTTDRELLTYNAQDSLLGIISQDYIGGIYINTSRASATYTGNLLTFVQFETWNGTSWDNSGNIIFEYNGAGKETKYQAYELFPGLGIVLFVELRSYYDSQNNLTNKANYFLNFSTQMLEPIDSTVYFNSAGKLNATELFRYQSGNYNKDSRKDYFYDAQQRITKIESKDWNLGALIYENNSEETFFYSSTRLDYDSTVLKLWDGIEYINDSKIERIFNTNNLITVEQYSIWNGSFFENSERISNLYNNKNELIEVFVEEYDNGIWIGTYRDYYNYGTVGINFQASKTLSGKIFPNPATDEFSVQIKSETKSMGDLTIIELSGRVVFSQNLIPINKGENTLLINENFNPGIYLINLKTINSHFVGKLTVD